MKLQFKNGTKVGCTAPIEQKIFKSSEAAGWLLLLSLTQSLTSEQLDDLLNVDNISKLIFLTDGTDEEESETLFELNDYDKVTSVVIRHSEEENKTKAEIQMSKGV